MVAGRVDWNEHFENSDQPQVPTRHAVRDIEAPSPITVPHRLSLRVVSHEKCLQPLELAASS